MIFHETIFPFMSDPYSSSSPSNIPLPHLFPSVASPHDPLLSFPISDIVTDTIPAPTRVSPTTSESTSTTPLPDPISSLSSNIPVLD